ncbi:hypothetical protein E8E14_010226 [Neopestalotiopsis sp. 37M]|nr:hypothetical protein E8E14_010226 [Neopestalotiopsis sp. 37M]
MTERDHDPSKEPRKRIAVAVSSTETPLRDGPTDFGYTMDAARAYQARGSASSHNAISQYATDMAAGDMMAYRSSAYPYSGSSSSSGGGKGYYSSVSGWGAGGFGEDSVDYGLNYSYPHMSSDPVHMVSGCRYGSSAKAPVYVDSEASSYTYGNLVHRPAASHELPTLSLSGMATTLTTATVTPDRLPTITSRNNLSSKSTYRNHALPGHYGGSGKTSSVHSSDVGYSGLSSGFETPVTYGSASSIPANMSGRSSHADTSFASQSAHHSLAAAAAGDSIYGSDHTSYRNIHDSDSYIYSDRLDGSRRDSHSSAGGTSAGSVLSNGQVYVPDTQSHAPAAAAHGYSVSAASASGAPPASVVGTGRGSSASQTAGHRRSGGNLRSA